MQSFDDGQQYAGDSHAPNNLPSRLVGPLTELGPGGSGPFHIHLNDFDVKALEEALSSFKGMSPMVFCLKTRTKFALWAVQSHPDEWLVAVLYTRHVAFFSLFSFKGNFFSHFCGTVRFHCCTCNYYLSTLFEPQLPSRDPSVL